VRRTRSPGREKGVTRLYGRHNFGKCIYRPGIRFGKGQWLPIRGDPSFECRETGEKVTPFDCDKCPLYQHWDDNLIRKCKHDYEKSKAIDEENRKIMEETIRRNQEFAEQMEEERKRSEAWWEETRKNLEAVETSIDEEDRTNALGYLLNPRCRNRDTEGYEEGADLETREDDENAEYGNKGREWGEEKDGDEDEKEVEEENEEEDEEGWFRGF
jgi:hypothetical protein